MLLSACKCADIDYHASQVGPSSSHTVGPMRAGKIFVTDLANLDLLEKVCTIPFIVHPQSADVREWESRTCMVTWPFTGIMTMCPSHAMAIRVQITD
jgi:hypothetical protein